VRRVETDAQWGECTTSLTNTGPIKLKIISLYTGNCTISNAKVLSQLDKEHLLLQSIRTACQLWPCKRVRFANVGRRRIPVRQLNQTEGARRGLATGRADTTHALLLHVAVRAAAARGGDAAGVGVTMSGKRVE
jgi:hypothetical protein